MRLIKVLIVDDERDWVDTMSELLDETSFPLDVITCTEPSKVASILASVPIDVVFLDLVMPGIKGSQILGEIAALYPRIKTLMVTGIDDLDSVVECMRLGAADYLVKGSQPELLLQRLKSFMEHVQLELSYQKLTAKYLGRGELLSGNFDRILTRDSEMLDVIGYLDSVSQSIAPVSIQGEAGTGKSLLASCLGRDSPPETLDCSVLGSSFLEQLCGVSRGHQGAAKSRQGALHRSSLVIIQEVDSLDLPSQAVLRDIIKHKGFSPVGTDLLLPCSARLVFTSNSNLRDSVKSGKLRADLFYHISLHQVALPPLRQRIGDLDVLIPHIVAQHSPSMREPMIPDEIYELLGKYDFPGNIAELESLIVDAVMSSEGNMLSLSTIRRLVQSDSSQEVPMVSHKIVFPDPLPTLSEVNEAVIVEALNRCGGSQKNAAKLLGLSPAALSRRLAKL